MTRESILMQYQSESLEALKSVANIGKPFEKVFMDAMKLFMAIPGRITKSICRVQEKPLPWILPIFPSPERKPHGWDISGQVVPENTNGDLKSWESES